MKLVLAVIVTVAALCVLQAESQKPLTGENHLLEAEDDTTKPAILRRRPTMRFRTLPSRLLSTTPRSLLECHPCRGRLMGVLKCCPRVQVRSNRVKRGLWKDIKKGVKKVGQAVKKVLDKIPGGVHIGVHGRFKK